MLLDWNSMHPLCQHQLFHNKAAEFRQLIKSNDSFTKKSNVLLTTLTSETGDFGSEDLIFASASLFFHEKVWDSCSSDDPRGVSGLFRPLHVGYNKRHEMLRCEKSSHQPWHKSVTETREKSWCFDRTHQRFCVHTRQGWRSRVSPPQRRVKTGPPPVPHMFQDVGGERYFALSCL